MAVDAGGGTAGVRTMKASEFKAKCLKLMDEVAETGEEILITKRGDVRLPSSCRFVAGGARRLVSIGIRSEWSWEISAHLSTLNGTRGKSNPDRVLNP